MSRNKIGVLAATAAGLLALAACGGGGSSSSSSDSASSPGTSADSSSEATGGSGDASKLIVVNLYSQALPYFQDLAAGVTDAAIAAGYTPEVVFGQTDPALQFTQIQNAISKAPAGIIVAPIDQQSLIPVFKEGKSAGIQMVTVADNLAAEGVDQQLAYVGIEYEDIGALKAQKIADAIGGAGKVGVVHGIRGLHFSEAQWDGAKEVFAKYPDIKLIDVGYAGGFSTDLGLEKAENILTQSPDVAAIYFDNDDLALGGILAAKSRGIAMDKIFIVGADGGGPARDAARAGDLDYSISFCGYATGVVAVQVIIDKVAGGMDPSGPTVPIAVFEFTPDNVDELEAKVADKSC